MPTYVYRYNDTGETFEVTQRIVEDALTEYPRDSVMVPVRRVPSSTSKAQFKGKLKLMGMEASS